MACRTRAAVAAFTPGSSFTTRETVFNATPAAAATSFIVGRPGLLSTTVRIIPHLSRYDNVVKGLYLPSFPEAGAPARQHRPITRREPPPIRQQVSARWVRTAFRWRCSLRTL